MAWGQNFKKQVKPGHLQLTADQLLDSGKVPDHIQRVMFPIGEITDQTAALGGGYATAGFTRGFSAAVPNIGNSMVTQMARGGRGWDLTYLPEQQKFTRSPVIDPKDLSTAVRIKT